MAFYRLYYIGSNGHIQDRVDYDTPDDLGALARAQQLCGIVEIEVWQGARFVARVALDGTASIAPRSMAGANAPAHQPAAHAE